MKKKVFTSLLLACSVLLPGAFADTSKIETDKIDNLTVYVARKVITMEPSMPEAEAVAVANGRIVSVGTLESLKPWTDKFPTTIDETFEDKILMPGFIDPHVHPSLPAVLTLFPFLAPEDWTLPTGFFPAARTHEEYIAALKEQVKNFPKNPYYKEGLPFISWGFHQLFHGDVDRAELDELFPDTPVILWHRSFHEVIANSAAIKMLGIDKGVARDHPVDIKWEKGLFSEFAAKSVFFPKVMPLIMTPERYTEGMKHFGELVHLGGVTSVMDMGVGIFGDPEGEIALIRKSMKENDTPARVVLTPIITDFIVRDVSPRKALKQVEKWTEESTDQVMFDKHFKLMIDGAAFSGLAKMGFPGYMDGHKGVGLVPREATYEYAKEFWDAGYQLHAHVTGDHSTELLINLIDRLLKENPRFGHRATLEHFMYAREDQVHRMAELGMAISANTYYQHILSDIYADQWLGEDRARNMVPLGAAVRAGVPYAFHSDNPMAPLSPLTLAWAAVTRTTISGGKNNQNETVSVDEAMKAITINAAWMMRMEDEIGSIVAGKKADFTVLEDNPYKVWKKNIKDIEIWGTVFEGKKYPLKTNTTN